MLPKAKSILKQYFGYDDFKMGQAQIIENILSSNDVLGIMPTGAGKSICYQIPAIIFPNTTLVVSPLISLMKDQVDTLIQSGVSCGFINSSLDPLELDLVMRKARMGEYKLLYIAPERLQNEGFLRFLQDVVISMVAIDEAHCVSQWGHDFRPSYKYISSVIKTLTTRPVVTAFTATATEQVKHDIINLLDLQNPYIATTGFDRPNLFFEIRPMIKAEKYATIMGYIQTHSDQSGIIYCNTRKDVESVASALVDDGIDATYYHAGLSNYARDTAQEDFIYGRKKIIVATNAFGMGIDKPDVRFVIHHGMPKSIESYYQEAGRAGRDGQPADCIMLFSADDIRVNRFLIMNTESEDDEHKKDHMEKLQQIVNYCYTDRCLRGYLLNYFGEKTDSNCNNCSNCSDMEKIKFTDITTEAQKILSCIKRMNESYGAGLVCSVLRGSKSRKVHEFGFEKLSTYGIMSEYKTANIKGIITYLVAQDYLTQTQQQYSILKLNLNSYKILKGNLKVMKKEPIEVKKSFQVRSDAYKYDQSLFNALVGKRNELATKQNLPAYIILNDMSLKEMSNELPVTDEEFLKIHGIGQHKLEHYGEIFMGIIRKYCEDNPEKIKNKSVTKPKKTRSGSGSKDSKPNTRIITYEMFMEGNSLADIAAKREVAVSTVENHLVDCKLMGYRVDGIVQEDQEQVVLNVIDEFGTERLRTIKENLPTDVTYATIKYYVGLHSKQNK